MLDRAQISPTHPQELADAQSVTPKRPKTLLSVGFAGLRQTTLGVGLLMLLAMLLPFELSTPLLIVGPFSITNVEVVLYATLIIWVGQSMRTRRIQWTPLHIAVIGCGLALLLAALFAPSERSAAWKFTLRSLSGCALFFASADILRKPEWIRRVASMLVIGATLSAIAALAEIGLPACRPVLLLFKTRIFNVGEYIRAGGTFEYPNTAAMFWEAVLPLAIGLGVAGRRSRSSGRILTWCGLGSAGATAILTQAILFSASRAALFGVGLAVLVGLVLAWRVVPAGRSSVLFSTGAALLVLAGNVLANPLTALRFQSESNDTWFRAEINPQLVNAGTLSPVLTIESGASMTMTVGVRNTSIVLWHAEGAQPVRLSYHWLEASTHKTMVREGMRTLLPHDLAPQDDVTLSAVVIAPYRPGQYVLQWDLLQEHVAWFSQYGNPTVDMAAQVKPATVARVTAPLQPVTGLKARIEPTRRDLWRAAIQMWVAHPVFGIGPDNFRHTYGPYLNLATFNTAVHTNNWYIETLINLGLIGVLALTMLMLSLIRIARRAISTANLNAAESENTWLLLGVLIGLLTYFVHGLLDYFFEFTPTYSLFWLLMGMVARLQIVRPAPPSEEVALAHS